MISENLTSNQSLCSRPFDSGGNQTSQPIESYHYTNNSRLLPREAIENPIKYRESLKLTRRFIDKAQSRFAETAEQREKRKESYLKKLRDQSENLLKTNFSKRPETVKKEEIAQRKVLNLMSKIKALDPKAPLPNIVSHKFKNKNEMGIELPNLDKKSN